MSIIKAVKYKMPLLVIAVLAAIILLISYISYTKYKAAEKEQYLAFYNKAFEQVENTSKLITDIIENKSRITDKEIIALLNDADASMQEAAGAFEAISPYFTKQDSKYNADFMRDLIQLYEGEITRLQHELAINEQQADLDSIRKETFIRLNLMNSDLQKIVNINAKQFNYYSYKEVRKMWISLIDLLEYKEITKVYKLKYANFFVKGYFFPFKK